MTLHTKINVNSLVIPQYVNIGLFDTKCRLKLFFKSKLRILSTTSSKHDMSTNSFMTRVTRISMCSVSELCQ